MNAARADPDPALAARLNALLGSAPPGTTYVARVVEASTGRELYAHDPDRPVAPASNAKLATTAAALDRFGPDHVLRTYLAADGDDLWIVGTGDPACGDRRLEQANGRKRLAILDDWADALAKRGVTRVKGKLIIDDGVFDDERVGPTWPKSELTDYWSAPLTGLTLNNSCVAVTAYPGRLEVEPTATGVTVIDRTRADGPAETPSMTRAPAADVFTVTGKVTKKVELDWKAVVDPGLFFADAFRTRLAARGVAIDGPTERAPRAAAAAKWGPLKDADRRDGRVVAAHETVMSDVLWRTNKQSQNLFADALCKLQGRAWDRAHGRDAPGSWRAGGEAVHDFLRRSGIDDAKFVGIDGSGLSSDDRATARMISDLLLKMSAHRHAKEFRASLSVCGKDGTLDDRMTDIAGRVQGKSGTIDGVKALSGYLTTRRGDLLVFSLIYNGIPDGASRRCAGLQDDACRAMADWPVVGPATAPATAPAGGPSTRPAGRG